RPAPPRVRAPLGPPRPRPPPPRARPPPAAHPPGAPLAGGLPPGAPPPLGVPVPHDRRRLAPARGLGIGLLGEVRRREHQLRTKSRCDSRRTPDGEVGGFGAISANDDL